MQMAYEYINFDPLTYNGPITRLNLENFSDNLSEDVIASLIISEIPKIFNCKRDFDNKLDKFILEANSLDRLWRIQKPSESLKQKFKNIKGRYNKHLNYFFIKI